RGRGVALRRRRAGGDRERVPRLRHPPCRGAALRPGEVGVTPTPVATERTVADLTTTEAAVLALLMIEGEHSGYDLQKLVTKSIAHVWSPARSGLYAVLPRLEREGLVSSRRVSQKARPAKQLYTITRAGRAAIHSWL